MVLRRCRTLLRNEDDAADAMHDVFVQALRYEDKLDARAPSSLLFRMATHISLNKIRTKKRHPENREDELLASIASSDDLEESSHRRLLLGRLWNRHEEFTRVMAVLHLVDGMTHAEVAKEVGMSVSGVRKRLRTLSENFSESGDAL